jgi:hypothetical protein
MGATYPHEPPPSLQMDSQTGDSFPPDFDGHARPPMLFALAAQTVLAPHDFRLVHGRFASADPHLARLDAPEAASQQTPPYADAYSHASASPFRAHTLYHPIFGLRYRILQS